jgi:hypothetical protein
MMNKINKMNLVNPENLVNPVYKPLFGSGTVSINLLIT